MILIIKLISQIYKRSRFRLEIRMKREREKERQKWKIETKQKGYILHRKKNYFLQSKGQ
jgi:hypothetical protein